jgi:hypothetical protein
MNGIAFMELSTVFLRPVVSTFGITPWRGCQLFREKDAYLYCMVGITNSAPSFTPDGQREVTVFVLV